MAFVSRDMKCGKVRWRIIWHDATKGPGRSGRRYASCNHGRHKEAFDAALLTDRERMAFSKGAKTNASRRILCKYYQSLEKVKEQESVRAGGFGRGPRYETPLRQLMDSYIERVRTQVAVREARGGRAGKAPATLVCFEYAAEMLKGFLDEIKKPNLQSGELSGEILKEFKDHLVAKTSKKKVNDKAVPLSTPTINRILRTLKSVFNHYLDDDDARPYFRITERSLSKALKTLPESRGLPEKFDPSDLAKFLKAAQEIDSKDRLVEIERKRKGKIEVFKQTMENRSKVFPWAVFLALTGCRLHEAAGLKWSDVDLKHGSITFRSKKTGRDRRLMLNDSKDTISPALLQILKHWREENPSSIFVLPETSREGEPKPVWPKHPWRNLQELAGVKIKPKALRSNWTSYAVSMGVPASVVALWAGHSPAVLERHYLAYAHGSLDGKTMEDCMGINEILEKEITQASSQASSGLPSKS